MTVYLLEYRRYHNLLVSGDPRPRAAVSCARLHHLLAGTLLSDQPHSPEVRQLFLASMERQLDGLAYPVEDGCTSNPLRIKRPVRSSNLPKVTPNTKPSTPRGSVKSPSSTGSCTRERHDAHEAGEAGQLTSSGCVN